jgi:PAS domain S-box-containing protein
VLQVINSSPGDLAPVFDAMVEKAMRLCEAPFGMLHTYDGGEFHIVSKRGVTPELAEYLRQPVRVADGQALYRIVRGRENVVHEANITEEEGYREGNAARRAMADLGGARTQLAVALRKDNALLGAFTIYRREVRPFTDRQIALVLNFAAQAVVAMENARLITEQREALEQQTATAEVLQVINSSPGNLAPVFDAMLNKAVDLCGAAFGILLTYDGKCFHHSAFRNIPAAYVEFMREHPPLYGPASGPGRLALGERFVHMLDITDTDAYRSGEVNRRALADLAGARTVVAVALRKDSTLLGAIFVFRQEVRPFSAKQIGLLENFAAQGVIAMENARLLNEIRQRQAELRTTFDNMADGVAMFDAELRLAAWNRNLQQLLQLSDEFLATPHSFDEYIRHLTERGEFGEATPEMQIKRLRARLGDHYGFERTRPDGRAIEIRNNPMPDGGVVVIYSDITERKQSEAAIRAARDAAEAAYRDLKAAQANLIQAEKMASLGQLTAGIAHEIKNPLNFVNNFATLSVDLLDELKETAAPGFAALDEARRAEIDELTRTLAGNLEKINEHGNRADAIVRSMLEHSRGSSGEQRSANLNTLVDEALNLAYHGARAQDQSFNVVLQRDFDACIALITLVPQDVTRVLLNLFSNGFYAARRRQSMEATAGFEPTLKVATRELGDAVEIRVRDNGIGIAEEIKDKLFQPFFTTKPTGEGTGLGLSISYDIVTQQHGGSITVESKVGEFSEFTIRLPRTL